MLEPRLASHLLISALRRKVEAAGGFATVIASGDKMAGAIILVCRPQNGTSHTGENDPVFPQKPAILEREPTLEGPGAWVPISAQNIDNEEKISEYLAKRRRADPDLWIIELDVAHAERFAAEIIASA